MLQVTETIGIAFVVHAVMPSKPSELRTESWPYRSSRVFVWFVDCVQVEKKLNRSGSMSQK
jgi:hypothetical protein